METGQTAADFTPTPILQHEQPTNREISNESSRGTESIGRGAIWKQEETVGRETCLEQETDAGRDADLPHPWYLKRQ